MSNHTRLNQVATTIPSGVSGGRFAADVAAASALAPEPDVQAVTCDVCGQDKSDYWGAARTVVCTDCDGGQEISNPTAWLAARRKDWGAVTTAVGSRTPWGAADHVVHPAPGIAQVSTSGHGGIKLSEERNLAIPAPLRNRSGWYEEDCESHIVAMYHPEAFPHYLGGDLASIHADGERGVKDNFPDAYEKATGETIPFGVSSIRDERDWATKTAGQPKISTVGAKEHPDYPGMVVVNTLDGAGKSTRHMIPVADYQAASAQRQHGAATVSALLPASAVEVPELLALEPRHRTMQPVTEVDFSGLSASLATRATADLDKKWRDRDGQTFTMRERIEAGVYGGKTAMLDGSKTTYWLRHANDKSRVTPVSKAMFDAYAAPDDRTPLILAEQAFSRKQASLERARAEGFDFRRSDKYQAKVAKLEAEAQVLRAQVDVLRSEERAAEEPARLARLAERDRANKASLDAAYAQLQATAAAQSPR